MNSHFFGGGGCAGGLMLCIHWRDKNLGYRWVCNSRPYLAALKNQIVICKSINVASDR